MAIVENNGDLQGYLFFVPLTIAPNGQEQNRNLLESLNASGELVGEQLKKLAEIKNNLSSINADIVRNQVLEPLSSIANSLVYPIPVSTNAIGGFPTFTSRVNVNAQRFQSYTEILPGSDITEIDFKCFSDSTASKLLKTSVSTIIRQFLNRTDRILKCSVFLEDLVIPNAIVTAFNERKTSISTNEYSWSISLLTVIEEEIKRRDSVIGDTNNTQS